MSTSSTSTTAEPIMIDCPVDPTLGIDDPNNVFNCHPEETCCTVSLQPACCTKQSMNDAIVQQMILWIPLVAVVIAIALIVWWCRSDEACCDVEKPCLYRCGCKKYESTPDDDEEIDGDFGSRQSVRSSTTMVHDADIDPSELEAVAENLDATPDDEPVVAIKEDGEPNEEGEEKGENEDSPENPEETNSPDEAPAPGEAPSE